MSPHWLAAVIAGAIATLYVWSDLLTSKYPTTAFLIWRNRWLLILCSLYGVIALAIDFLSDRLIASSTLKIEGLWLDSPYIRAVIVGLASKAVIQFKFTTITIGANSFPFGPQVIIRLFEPFLLRKLLLEEFNALRRFVDPYAARHPDLNEVKSTIIRNIPSLLSEAERIAFEQEIDRDTEVVRLMERFLRFLGKKTFERTFVL